MDLHICFSPILRCLCFTTPGSLAQASALLSLERWLSFRRQDACTSLSQQEGGCFNFQVRTQNTSSLPGKGTAEAVKKERRKIHTPTMFATIIRPTGYF